MPAEAAGIRRYLDGNVGARAYATLDIAGIGRRNIADAVARAAAAGAGAVITAGFCGALDPALQTGDLHIASELRADDSDGVRPIPADARLAAHLRDAAGEGTDGPSVTVSAIAQPEYKAALWQSGAGVSVNMEDYWAAAAAADAGIPFAAVLVVFDTAGQTLPEYLADGDGKMRPARIALTLPIHPERAPELARLARQSRLAERRLTDCVTAAVSGLMADLSVGAAR